MDWIAQVVEQGRLTIASAQVWVIILWAIVATGAFTAFGTWVTRRIGLLSPGAPPTECLGVGLPAGVMIVIPWWAAIRSGGQSSFTPVAVAFLVVMVLAIARPGRPSAAPSPGSGNMSPTKDGTIASPAKAAGPAAVWLLAAAFLAIVALVYGSTMAVRSTSGAQPVDFLDTAYYSVLGRDLGSSGVEDPFGPAGLELIGVAPQAWYHWGELWLAAVPITALGTSPIDARYFFALPILLLAAAAATGTLVRRWTGSHGAPAYLFGFVACVFLSPIPLLAGPYFAAYASGLLFGISSYGLAAVAAISTLDIARRLTDTRPTWPIAAYAGSVAAVVLPAHIVIAVLGTIGVSAAGTFWVLVMRPPKRTLRFAFDRWKRPATWAVATLSLTAMWGFITGHGLGGSAPSTGVTAFNETWWLALASVVGGGGILLSIPLSVIPRFRAAPDLASACAGALAILALGAVVWGARLADFNMFHLFFGGLAVIATPIAAVATWSLLARLRASGRRTARAVLMALIVIQLEVAAVFTVAHLQRFGPFDYRPIPIAILDTIRSLPPAAKVAYRCALDEQSVWLPRLISVDAHTGHRIIPLCFQADLASALIGGIVDTSVEHPSFVVAPQRSLFPTRDANPSTAEIVAFMRDHGIEYILADPQRLNTLVPDAPSVIRVDGYELFRLAEQAGAWDGYAARR